MPRFALLNTRPAHQASALNALVVQAGGQSFHCPALQIESVPYSKTEQDAWVQTLQKAQLWVVTSTNAVPPLRALMEMLLQRWQQDKTGRLKAEVPAWQILAIGQATHQALQKVVAEVLGLHKNGQKTSENVQNPQSCQAKESIFELLPPLHLQKGQKRADSETLLQHPALQMLSAEKSVVLIKGEGGRNHLQQTLQQQGIQVVEMPLYRRVAAPFCAQSWQTFIRTDAPKIVLATSFESLQSVWQGWENWQASQAKSAMPQKALTHPLSEFSLLAFSPRIAELAQQAGWRGAIAITPATSNTGILQGIETLIKRVLCTK